MNVTLVYHAIAQNLSAAALATALGAIPLDADTASLLGLTLASDGTATSGNRATRTIVYTTAVSPPLMPNSQIGATMTNYYTSTFRQILSTPITADAVTVT